MRCLFLLAVFSAVATLPGAIAQPPKDKDKDGPLVVPLTVSPMAEPKPALKYLLLPDARDLNPGNQIPAFYKCFMEQHNFYRSKESIDQREKWAKAPLRELAQEKALIGYGGASTRQADYAARLENVDWAVLSQLKEQGIYLLLPDMQQLRELAQVLRVKLRGEIARHEFDHAIYTAQTMLALSRSLESHPTLIASLVGVAIASIVFDALEEFIQQPGAPNLFWALVDLPNPFVNLRNGMAGEKVWLKRDFDVLGSHEILPETELQRLAKLLDGTIQVERDKKQTPLEWYQQQAADPNALKDAAERLSKLGFPKDKLAKYSPLQIIMADDFMKYLVFRDDLMKWTNLPLAQIPSEVNTTKPPKGVLIEYVAAIYKVKSAQARLQQRIDNLRITEAIRAYAASHGGKLPTTLDEIKLPMPTDPISGKPYHYEVKDGKAIVHGMVPADRVNDRLFNRVLEISVQKP